MSEKVGGPLGPWVTQGRAQEGWTSFPLRIGPVRQEGKAEQRQCQHRICEGDIGEPGHSVPEEKVLARSRVRLSWAEEDMGPFWPGGRNWGHRVQVQDKATRVLIPEVR